MLKGKSSLNALYNESVKKEKKYIVIGKNIDNITIITIITMAIY